MIPLVTLALACIAMLNWWCCVPRVRITDPDAPDFGALISRRSTILTGVVTLALSQVLWLVPPVHWWLWAGYLAIGVPLVGVDLLTTFLPRVLHRMCAATMAVGLVALATREPTAALAACGGAVAMGGFFYLVWRAGAGLGFGDVRLAVLIGAVSGQAGAMSVAVAALAGTLLGAIHAVLHHLWATRDPNRPRYFPYGPALFAGPFLAVVLGA